MVDKKNVKSQITSKSISKGTSLWFM